jgi:membrane associated rhomboid family serine protease
MRYVNATLIGANVAVFALTPNPALQQSVRALFALWPLGMPTRAGLGMHFQPWQPLTYAFLHDGIAHLALNMFALWMFGRDCEDALGARRYLLLYLAAVLSAAAVQVAVGTLTHSGAATIGASGGVFGVLLTFAVLYPRRRIMLLIPPIPMPAWLFVTLYGLVELGNGVLGTNAGVAHFAHLGGMIGAGLVLRHWYRTRRCGRRIPGSSAVSSAAGPRTWRPGPPAGPPTRRDPSVAGGARPAHPAAVAAGTGRPTVPAARAPDARP